jgi:CRISPR-associated endonuclease/helicase Cas3
MEPTSFQSAVQELISQGKSLLLVAPTGLGKTFAVTGDLQDEFRKTIYAVPLRALGSGIHDAIKGLKRNGQDINPVIHHGNLQESELFSEEVIITTYDQVVCAVPGLPLSLPLRSGHAVAGALLMSRLILDEVHLAWGISEQALTILLAIIEARKKLGLQTVVLTATMPDSVAKTISGELGLELVIVGENYANDEGLKLREANRQVTISTLELKNKGKGGNRKLDLSLLDESLLSTQSKRICFVNTVDRLQETYDRMVAAGLQADKITVLHNRMPKPYRAKAEEQVRERFGKDSSEGDWLLLTTQVSEAGLDISAPLVISDPAPVDTLVQRAGRCARWFRNGVTQGEFVVLKPKAKADIEDRKKGLAVPYRASLVHEALRSMPQYQLNWAVEREWINNAWGGGPREAGKALAHSFDETTFALNLFDRAAQEHKPGEIASVFRKILSVEVAVEEGEQVYQSLIDDNSQRDLQSLLTKGKYPETSSISLSRAYYVIRGSQDGATAVIRFENDEFMLHLLSHDDYVRPGDVLILPSTIAYLHRVKGLCFGDGSTVDDAILTSCWPDRRKKQAQQHASGRRQTLLEHTRNVMEGAYCRLAEPGAYHDTLVKILKSLEPEKDTEQLAILIAELTRVAAAFHDLGKADKRWQARAREIDSECSAELIGRTLNTGERIGIPHTPPGYAAAVKTCELLVGPVDSAEYLIRAIALATARHHSSFLNPSTVKNYVFQPHPKAAAFMKETLVRLNAPKGVLDRVKEIINAAKTRPTADQVPLMLPNDDLFPIYALVGRAILLADREDAKGEEIEQWGNAQ